MIKGGNIETGVELEIPLQITNPSKIALKTNSDVILDLIYNQAKVGQVVLPNLSLVPGVNKILAKSFVNPEKSNEQAISSTRKLFSQFTNGVASDVVVNNGASRAIPMLNKALGALSLPQRIPASNFALIRVILSFFPFAPF